VTCAFPANATPCCQIDDALAALPATGVTMETLEQAANMDKPMHSMCVDKIMKKLHITKLSDTVAFCFALGKLRGGAGAGAE
jgi:hypothetical protein